MSIFLWTFFVNFKSVLLIFNDFYKFSQIDTLFIKICIKFVHVDVDAFINFYQFANVLICQIRNTRHKRSLFKSSKTDQKLLKSDQKN